MAPKHRIIIDTDPGVDDTLALLLALSANPEDLVVELISVTFGNVPVEQCLRNVVTLFHQIEKEMAWRKSIGKPEGFDMLKALKPIVAVGADEPLADQLIMADYFHGLDGLGGIHTTHPHFSPVETWRNLFKSALSSKEKEAVETIKEIETTHHSLFTPSQTPAHEEILRILRENEPGSITIVAIGPLTNLARASATNPETFLRAKDVIVMGGTLEEPGNVTPVAEFNTYADSIAAARVFSLTSKYPLTTIPPTPPTKDGKHPPFLSPYPSKLSKQLRVTLFPLDITTTHWLRRGTFNTTIQPLLDAKSPLAEWVYAFMTSTLRKMESLHEGHEGDFTGLSLHDPLCVWYLLTLSHPGHAITLSAPQDLRVETSGQWTRGMYVLDRRDRIKMDREDSEGGEGLEGEMPEEVVGDAGRWLDGKSGNRILVAEGSRARDIMGKDMLERIFGLGVHE